jgi:hypothetical protein
MKTCSPGSDALFQPKFGDLFVAAKHSWIVGFDNTSYMPDDFLNALCTLSTGVAVGNRKLYSNAELFSYEVWRPLVFTSIHGNMADRSDLAQRTIQLVVPQIEDVRAREDVEAEFVKVWPGVLGALLDGSWAP